MTSISSETDDTALVGWKFNSHSLLHNVFTEQADQRIFLISLIDGTLMAIDSKSGTTLWSINEEDSSLSGLSYSHSHTADDNLYVPSTTGDLYKVDGSTAELITYDKSGRTHFNKRYIISSSRQDIITLGINILTGKLYYYCSSNSCYKNYTNEIADDEYVNLLVVKRIIKVLQMIDLSSGKEVVKFTHGNHELFMYNDSGVISALDHGGTTLRYDIESNTIYGVSRGNSFVSEGCWKVPLSSAIVNSWIVDRTGKSFVIFEQDLVLLLSNGGKLRNIDPLADVVESTDDDLQCKIPVYINVFENFAVINKIFEPRRSHCKISKIHAFYSEFDPEDRELLSSKLTEDQLIEAITKIKMLPPKIPPVFLPPEPGRQLKVKVSWRSISLNKINKLNSSLTEKANNSSEIVVIVSIFAFWKEILSAAFIVFTITWYVYKKYKKLTAMPQLPKLAKESYQPERASDVSKTEQKETPVGQLNPPLVTSRYATDFEHIESIGSGGCGVVAKARNLVDDCVYAVKRVSIPNCVVARRRVMREVKALAKLNHPNIIRFYNAWLEISPEPCRLPPSIEKTESSSASSIAMAKPSDTTSSFDVFKRCPQRKNDYSDDDLIVFERNDDPSPDHLWEGVDPSSSLECSGYSSLSNLNNFTNYSFIQECTCSENCFHDQKVSLFIQMELCHKQTLRSWLWRNSTRNIDQCLSIFVQILHALHFVHSNGLMHRDLKPSNIFFSFDGTVKIGDFGLVTQYLPSSSELNGDGNRPPQQDYQWTMTKLVGTQLYMSPELLEDEPYNFKVDIFSLGLILFELLVPFKTDSERRTTLTMVRLSNFPDDCPSLTEDYVAFIEWMLKVKPAERPSTSQLLEHELVHLVLSNTPPSSSPLPIIQS